MLNILTGDEVSRNIIQELISILNSLDMYKANELTKIIYEHIDKLLTKLHIPEISEYILNW